MDKYAFLMGKISDVIETCENNGMAKEAAVFDRLFLKIAFKKIGSGASFRYEQYEKKLDTLAKKYVVQPIGQRDTLRKIYGWWTEGIHNILNNHGYALPSDGGLSDLTDSDYQHLLMSIEERMKDEGGVAGLTHYDKVDNTKPDLTDIGADDKD